jgi:hypothetical protein
MPNAEQETEAYKAEDPSPAHESARFFFKRKEHDSIKNGITEPLFQLMNMFPAHLQALQCTEKLLSLQDYTHHSNLSSHEFLTASDNNVLQTSPGPSAIRLQ